MMEKLDYLLDNYFNNKTALLKGSPTVQFLSEQLNVSPRYLGDMLRTLKRHNTQQHIHLKLIEKAKEILATSNITVSEAAYPLGFEHSQSFNKFFKSKTYIPSLEFKSKFN